MPAMAEAGPPPTVKLICGMLTSALERFSQAEEALA